MVNRIDLIRAAQAKIDAEKKEKAERIFAELREKKRQLRLENRFVSLDTIERTHDDYI